MRTLRTVLIAVAMFTLVGSSFAAVDNYLFSQGQGANHTCFYHQGQFFTRANNVVLTVKVWNDANNPVLGSGQWGVFFEGPFMPATATPMYPWYVDWTPSPAATALPDDWQGNSTNGNIGIVAGIRAWMHASGGWAPFAASGQYIEAIDTGIMSAAYGVDPCSVELNQAFDASNSKANCVNFKFTLGSSAGVMFEWAVGSGTTFTPEFDARDASALVMGNTVSPQVAVGFCASNGGGAPALNLDDIIVTENGTTAFSEDWSAGFDTTKWTVTDPVLGTKVYVAPTPGPTDTPVPTATATATATNPPQPTATGTQPPVPPVELSSFDVE